MRSFINRYWLLILALVLATFLRFYNLSSLPALNADEASNSYDAYSLIKTGMDQHGHPWPITFQSFNDYKPGLYVYLDLPFVKFMGLTPLAARIPGAIAGVLSVLAIYFLVQEMFNRKLLSDISAFFLAISPWDIHFSRGGWEVNVATFFILFGTYLFLRFVKNKKFINLALSILFLDLSLYAYHAARVVVPLLGFCAIVIYMDEIFSKSNFKKIFFSVLLGIVILTPLIFDLASPGALSRVAGVGLFADPGPINRIDEQRGEYDSPTNKIGVLLHNKVVNYSIAFMQNWASHFSGEFLFMTGDVIQRNKVPDMGEMYLFDIVFLAVGILLIAKTFGSNKKSNLLLISWLLIAPVPSALTFQAPNALRAQNMVVPLIIISSLGFYQVILWIKGIDKPALKTVLLAMVFIAIIWNFARYEHMYWNHMPEEYPYSSQYGLPELTEYVLSNGSRYQNIFVTNRYDQPYILFLFYMKYPPQNFQFHHVLSTRDEFGFSTVADFDKYHFGPIDLTSIQNNYPNSLIIGTPKEIPQSANIVKRIYGTNGFEYFDIVSN